MIYSKQCNNPRTMVIYDPKTGFTYNQEAAEKAPTEIRKRLINLCRWQGYPVLSLKECKEAFNNPEWYKKLKRLQDDL